MPTSTFQIVAAESVEFLTLENIELAAAQLFPANRIPDLDDTYPRDLLTSAQQQGLLILAQINEQTVGFAVCHLLAEYLHLAELAVHPDQGRRGIGRALVQHTIEIGRARRQAGVVLTTFADIRFNGPFYASMNFQILPNNKVPAEVSEILASEYRAGMTQRVAMLYKI